MATQKLKFSKSTSLFGLTISLVNKDKSFTEVIAKDMDFDPLTNQNVKLTTGGWQFRSPNIKQEDWEPFLTTLRNVGGKFNLSANVNKENKTVTAHIRFEDKGDIAVFAWSNINVWEKWSDALQTEAEAEMKRKPTKIKIGKDGRVTAKVTVTTLGDEEQDNTFK